MAVSLGRGVSILPEERSLNLIIDGGGSAITTGAKGYVRVDFPCAIWRWTILADQVGSAVVDVKKVDYGNFPSTTSIAGSELPTLSAARKNEDQDLTTWSNILQAGDILEFVVNSASTVTRVTVDLYIQ